MDIVQCLSRTDAEALVRHCLESGFIIPSRHFRDELEADNLDMLDAKYVLKHGHIYREPEIDVKTREWKYRIEGKTIDGARIAVVFCFKTTDTCFCITVFSLELQ